MNEWFVLNLDINQSIPFNKEQSGAGNIFANFTRRNLNVRIPILRLKKNVYEITSYTWICMWNQKEQLQLNDATKRIRWHLLEITKIRTLCTSTILSLVHFHLNWKEGHLKLQGTTIWFRLGRYVMSQFVTLTFWIENERMTVGKFLMIISKWLVTWVAYVLRLPLVETIWSCVNVSPFWNVRSDK